jgi:hypothetical protein
MFFTIPLTVSLHARFPLNPIHGFGPLVGLLFNQLPQTLLAATQSWARITDRSSIVDEFEVASAFC